MTDYHLKNRNIVEQIERLEGLVAMNGPQNITGPILAGVVCDLLHLMERTRKLISIERERDAAERDRI